jgi:ABC-2 type transport system ATP-binding protein
VIACDTPAGLIRDLALEASVSATIGGGALDASALRELPGVVAAEIASREEPPRLKLQTDNAQATIVGLLSLASERGIVLDDLTSTRATLEDVFLARTGRAYADEGDAPPPDEAAPPAKRGRRGRKAAA